jgi:hypothetical protein
VEHRWVAALCHGLEQVVAGAVVDVTGPVLDPAEALRKSMVHYHKVADDEMEAGHDCEVLLNDCKGCCSMQIEELADCRMRRMVVVRRSLVEAEVVVCNETVQADHIQEVASIDDDSIDG